MLQILTHWYSDGTSVSVMVEDMSRNKCFFFYVLYPFMTCLLALSLTFLKCSGLCKQATALNWRLMEAYEFRTIQEFVALFSECQTDHNYI
jgi:hypothetical protein